MNTTRLLCTLLLSHSVPAALIDFNDIAIGTEVSSLNPYGAAVISTRFWVSQSGTTVAESFTRGVIGTGPNGSPSVVIEADIRDLTDPEQFGLQRWNIDIGVSFQTPMSTFSLDAFSGIWSTPLIYVGVNALGELFTSSAHIPASFDESFTHFDIAAPTDGYITGFHFSQYENFFDIHLAMDNLDYTPIPETIGLPTFVFTICTVLFVHRWMKAARK